MDDECEECRKEREGASLESVQTLRRKTTNEGEPTEVPPIVYDVLRSPGQRLDAATRAFFEPRFGHDFSRVRVHADAKAADSARAVNALAYAVGGDLVFGPGQYAPRSQEGRRLLAHELAHTIQQRAALEPSLGISMPEEAGEMEADAMAAVATGATMRVPVTPEHGGSAPAVIHRAPDKPAARDVVIVLSKDIGEEAEVLAPSALVIREDKLDGLLNRLREIDFQIGTLYVSAHSSPQGDILFGYGQAGGRGLTLNPGFFSSKLRGVLKSPPKQIDFRGCSIGSTPKAVEQYRKALGAGSAVASNCFYGVQPSGSVLLNGKAITDRSQLDSPAKKTAFDQQFPKVIAKMKPYDKCILDPTPDGYFRGKGHLYAVIQLPDLGKPKVFRCISAIEPEDVDPSQASVLPGKSPESCKRIVVSAPHGTKLEKE